VRKKSPLQILFVENSREIIAKIVFAIAKKNLDKRVYIT